MDDLPQRLVDVPVTDVTGLWLRHCTARAAATTLDGRTGDARWGSLDGFPVLYLGSPLESVIVEAYRHLVDPYLDQEEREKIAAGIHGRLLVHARIAVTNILDLRSPGARLTAGLPMDILVCGTDDAAGYAACQKVAQVAHQLGRHGIIAPAATRLGETLVLFPKRLPTSERPVREGEDEVWNGLPPDPRQTRRPNLHVVRDA
jgi:hypothetical protein